MKSESQYIINSCAILSILLACLSFFGILLPKQFVTGITCFALFITFGQYFKDEIEFAKSEHQKKRFIIFSGIMFHLSVPLSVGFAFFSGDFDATRMNNGSTFLSVAILFIKIWMDEAKKDNKRKGENIEKM